MTVLKQQILIDFCIDIMQGKIMISYIRIIVSTTAVSQEESRTWRQSGHTETSLVHFPPLRDLLRAWLRQERAKDARVTTPKKLSPRDVLREEKSAQDVFKIPRYRDKKKRPEEDR